VVRLVWLSVLVGTSVWFDQSTFVPFATDRASSYVLCTPAIWRLLAAVVLVGAALTGASIVFRHTRLIETGNDRGAFSASAALTPLALVAVNLLGLGLLSESLRETWSPVAYVGASLYPFLWVAAIGLVIRNVYLGGGATCREPLTSRWRALDAATQSLLLDVAIAATVAGLVIATSPKIRFSATPVGDEPKYLRYAENWWQGRGMDMDGVKDAADIPASKRGPQFLRNFSTLVPAIERDLSQLVSDAAYLGNAKHWGHQFNKATYVGNWFVTGKNGGLYQIHQPGISIVILPAYAIDRWLFDGGHGRLADDLFAVNTVMLLIFLVLAGVTFRLIDLVVQHRATSALTTLACLVSLPLASFVFQFYPETLGAVLVTAIVSQTIREAPVSTSKAAAIGAALGWLVWLQVRFALLAATLFLWVLWGVRRNPRAWLPIIGIAGLVVGLFCFYVYHVTGSVLPSALYAATPDPGFRASRLPTGLVGVLFDRENGLFALAPVFLLALPGLALMLRDRRTTALMIGTLFLALLIPVAGHGYETSGTSPLRQMVAVVPLAAVPIAVWLRSMRGRTLPLAFAGALMLISIQMAAAYNLRNDKTITQTITAGVSGWDPSFMFPLLRRTEQPGFDRRSLMVWEVVSVAAVASGFWWRSRRSDQPSRLSPSFAFGASLAIVSLAGLTAIGAGGPRRELRLLKTPAESLREYRMGCATGSGSIHAGSVP
jgi:hypothetical protein